MSIAEQVKEIERHREDLIANNNRLYERITTLEADLAALRAKAGERPAETSHVPPTCKETFKVGDRVQLFKCDGCPTGRITTDTPGSKGCFVRFDNGEGDWAAYVDLRPAPAEQKPGIDPLADIKLRDIVTAMKEVGMADGRDPVCFVYEQATKLRDATKPEAATFGGPHDDLVREWVVKWRRSCTPIWKAVEAGDEVMIHSHLPNPSNWALAIASKESGILGQFRYVLAPEAAKVDTLHDLRNAMRYGDCEEKANAIDAHVRAVVKEAK